MNNREWDANKGMQLAAFVAEEPATYNVSIQSHV